MDNMGSKRKLCDITWMFRAGENSIRCIKRESLHYYIDCQLDNIDSERQIDNHYDGEYMAPSPRSIKLN